MIPVVNSTIEFTVDTTGVVKTLSTLANVVEIQVTGTDIWYCLGGDTLAASDCTTSAQSAIAADRPLKNGDCYEQEYDQRWTKIALRAASGSATARLVFGIV